MIKCLNNTNFTICFKNPTTNEFCIPECYLNCQVHFPVELEQKFCLLNVCKCEIYQEIKIIPTPLIDSTNTSKIVNKSDNSTNINKTHIHNITDIGKLF